MTTLHTCNKTTANGGMRLGECLRMLSPGDALLLLEDAVYAALPAQLHSVIAADLLQGIQLYVLSEDLALRGISAKIHPHFTPITYKDFVSLCLVHDKVVSWY